MQAPVFNARFIDAANIAVRSIPPLWPLNASVAVNPYLGQSGEALATAGARLERVAGCPVTMPRKWYAERIASGEIADSDLAEALAAAESAQRPESVEALRRLALEEPPQFRPLPTVADLAAHASSVDWPALIEERVGYWAAGYFDQGQALWASPDMPDAYRCWRLAALHDLTPEIMGLAGFSRHVLESPEYAAEAIAVFASALKLAPEAANLYFHRLLMTMGGWAQYARYKLWQADLAGGHDRTVLDLLAIRLCWEAALFHRHGEAIARTWEQAQAAYAAPLESTSHHTVNAILQEAYERSKQRWLATTLAKPSANLPSRRPDLQAAFCIDVRSEVFRRALESCDDGIETLGFAGFFGLATSHRAFGSDLKEWRLPALLTPGLFSSAGEGKTIAAERALRVRTRADRAWQRFKLAAVSCFAFVEASGPAYGLKLLRDALALRPKLAPHDPLPHFAPEPVSEDRIAIAAAVLRAMSLTDRFAPLVLIVGHGAFVANNPHASGLHCGACGGYSGEVNARLLACLLNDPMVRTGLAASGIFVPSDTLFLAALHDTTTDRLTLYQDCASQAHTDTIARARRRLAAAGAIARTERAVRLPRATSQRQLFTRSKDWSEIRPEWGLAGCCAFIAAPRHRTSGKALHGRAFLHDYDWSKDTSFAVLEQIMTAPVVVASWISLQYYGSTVAPQVMGAGNKLIHNVAGGIAVVEGNNGAARAGLPWQSVHDGRNFIHEPLRLTVCIEAPREAITSILQRHDDVRKLFDYRWLHLLALDDHGRVAWRYAGNLEWLPIGSFSHTDHPVEEEEVA